MDVATSPKPLQILAVCAAWLTMWLATQGLFVINDYLPGGSLNVRLAWLTGYVAVVLSVALVVFRRFGRSFMPRSKLLWLYGVPLALLLALPFHYSGPVAVPLLAAMIVITAFWQDYLSFGLVQTFIGQRTSPLAAVLITGGLFAVGHVVFLAGQTAPLAFLTACAVYLAAGCLLAWLREQTRSIYATNAAHLSFLLVFTPVFSA
ncbi:CPBP family intramembrane glutamic endopeptidase [Nonomuraea typhae]|uniref:CPBP family intramembrane glutamic endopeptidase n=1 Tax=Nonomuraea typhae TaxID=2603600 RepID=UPI0012F8FFAB|nr:CPBP family intramembrane glutamic endopeptidase [Nonomuraea typhae]